MRLSLIKKALDVEAAALRVEAVAPLLRHEVLEAAAGVHRELREGRGGGPERRAPQRAAGE